MARYIIRLDDACPTMNKTNWDRVEALLDRYHIKPLVGVIPCCKDPYFAGPADEHFWEHVAVWADKGWTVCEHGYTHEYHPTKFENGEKYFQMCHGTVTEFAGVPFEEQKSRLEKGYQEFLSHGIKPTAFFAPSHTFDANTVEAVKGIPGMAFISDGYALQAYKKNGMTFLPSIFDSPFKMPFGTYTFVIHPKTLTEQGFARWEAFLAQNHADVIDAPTALQTVRPSQGVVGWLIERAIYIVRGIRDHAWAGRPR